MLKTRDIHILNIRMSHPEVSHVFDPLDFLCLAVGSWMFAEAVLAEFLDSPMIDLDSSFTSNTLLIRIQYCYQFKILNRFKIRQKIYSRK